MNNEPGYFTLMQYMCDTGDNRIQLAPLSNIIACDKNGNRHTMTIGISPEMFQEYVMKGTKFIGGLILIPAAAFDEVKSNYTNAMIEQSNKPTI
jgi:hypothetical protein